MRASTIRRRMGWLVTDSASVVVKPTPVNAERAWKRADSRDMPVRASMIPATRVTSRDKATTANTRISAATPSRYPGSSAGIPARMAGKAIITGSDSGIGKASAVALARAGFDVGVTWNTDEDGARDTAEEVRGLGRTAALRRLDVSDFAAAADTVSELAGELGGLDVFVNNAGMGRSHPFLEFPLEDWQDVIDVDLTGAFVCAQRAARIMVEAGNGGARARRARHHGELDRPRGDRDADDRSARRR